MLGTEYSAKRPGVKIFGKMAWFRMSDTSLVLFSYLYFVAGQQLDLLQREQQRPGQQVARRVREARQKPFRHGQVAQF